MQSQSNFLEHPRFFIQKGQLAISAAKPIKSPPIIAFQITQSVSCCLTRQRNISISPPTRIFPSVRALDLNAVERQSFGAERSRQYSEKYTPSHESRAHARAHLSRSYIRDRSADEVEHGTLSSDVCTNPRRSPSPFINV